MSVGWKQARIQLVCETFFTWPINNKL